MKRKRDAAYLAQVKKVLDLYAEGWTYELIAEETGMRSRQAVYMLLNREMARLASDEVERIEAQRAEWRAREELVFLNHAIAELWPRVEQGDLKATDRMLAILDRQAEILHLYPDDEQKGA